MKIVRKGCFETNSSSCHSFTLSSEAGIYDTLVDNFVPGKIIVNLEEYCFDWEIEEYNDPLTKLAYLLIDIGAGSEPKRLIGQFNDLLKLVERAIKEHTGLQLVVQKPGKESYSGYIDHQSHGTAISAISADLGKKFTDDDVVDRIKNFVFNPKSVLYIDNDNH